MKPAKCPHDSDGDGNCHLCHKTGKCVNAPSVTEKPMISERDAFIMYFGQGTCFWSSEDGYRTHLVIERNPNAPEDLTERERARMALFREFHWVKGLDWSKPLLERFVHEEVVDGWHDGPTRDVKEDEQPVWTFSEKETEFPVWVIEL